ncbi:hypothetical protein CHUAL_003743 [Chamberlinius hualienensis]
MQETSGQQSAYNNNNNSSEHTMNNKARLNEISFSLKRDFHKAGLSANDADDMGASSDDEDDEGSDKQEETVKKTPPPNGKKTKGRVKIKMEFIDNKLRRYTTFSKRKTGIMKKAYELSTLTGTQVMLLVASETGHVYTFATRKLQPMITSEAGKALIQTCLNSPDPLANVGHHSDQRMSATGFEETELTYTINDEDCKNEVTPNKSHHSSMSEASAAQSLSSSQMSLSSSIPMTTLLNSSQSHLGKVNNISMQLSKQHPGFATLIGSGMQTSSQHGESSASASVTVISASQAGTHPSASLPLMYQSAPGVVYAPSNAESVILSLGQNSAMQFSQDTSETVFEYDFISSGGFY